MAEVVLLAVAFQILIIAATWVLSESLGLGIDPELIAVVLPLVLFATIIPISIAGFGVREGAFVALLGEAACRPRTRCCCRSRPSPRLRSHRFRAVF